MYDNNMWMTPARYFKVACRLLIALAVPLIFWSRGYRAWCLAPIAVLPLGLIHASRLRSSETGAELNTLLGDTAKLLACYAGLFALGVAL